MRVICPLTCFLFIVAHSLGVDATTNLHKSSLYDRCLHQTSPSEESTFFVETANQILEAISSATTACKNDNDLGTDENKCLRRIDIEIADDAVVDCSNLDGGSLPLGNHGDCVFVRGGTIGKTCRIQVGEDTKSKNQESDFSAATAVVFFQDLVLEGNITIPDGVSLVSLDDTKTIIHRRVWCGKTSDSAKGDQALVLEDFDPDTFECHYLDAGPFVDPSSQARLTGETTLIYDTILDFAMDRNGDGHNGNTSNLDFFHVGPFVGARLGKSNRIPLEWLISDKSSDSINGTTTTATRESPPLSIRVETSTASPLITVGTDLQAGFLVAKPPTGDFFIDAILPGHTFPSHVFIQADEEVCVSSITLKIGDVDIYSRDMSAFSSCGPDYAIDYNHDDKCIRLSSSLRFRDFAFDMQKEKDDSDCSQISLRRDPDFMESFTFEVEGIDLEGLVYVDSLDDLELVPGNALDDKLRIPAFPTVGFAQNHSSHLKAAIPKLSKIKIMAYGVSLLEWDASTTFHCLSTCEPFAKPNRLRFSNSEYGTNATAPEDFLIAEAKFDLTATGCEQLSDIMLHQGFSGEEACTQVETPIDTVGELAAYLANLLTNGKRTLRVVPEITNFTTTITDFPDLAVPSHVRVQIDGSESQIIIHDVFVEVSNNATLEFISVTFEAIKAPATVINRGKLILEDCTLLNNTELESWGVLEVTGSTMENIDVNIADGLAEFSYGKIRELTRFVNEANSLLFDKMEASLTDFTFYSGEGNFVLTDAEVIYSMPNDDFLKTFCASDAVSATSPQTSDSFTKVNDVNECQTLCDSIAVCRGIWFDSEGLTGDTEDEMAMCGLCLPETRVACDLEGAFTLQKQPVVPFTELAVGFCPIAEPLIVNGLPSLTSSNECRGWCSTFSFCQAYTFDSSTSSCVFYDSPMVSMCLNATNSTLVIDSGNDSGIGMFARLPNGMCFPEGSHQLVNVGSGIETWLATSDDCAAFCGALAECAAFEIDAATSQCRYFSWEAMLDPSADCNRTAYISLQDASFPLGLSSGVEHFPCSADTSLSQLSLAAGGLKDCEIQCHTDPLCLAYTFQSTRKNTTVEDCFLWKDANYLDWLMNPDRCFSSFGDTYLITRRVDFVVTDDNENSFPCNDDSVLEAVEDAITIDHCKAICFKTAGCKTFSFDPDDGCRLTCPSSQASRFLASSNTTSGVQPALYTKEIDFLKLGYVEYSNIMSCATARIDEVKKTSISACRYLCDLSDTCVGFQHQVKSAKLPNFRGQAPTRTKIQRCELYSSVEIRECHAGSGERPKSINVAYQGKRLSEFHPAPSSSVFSSPGYIEPRGNGSIRACFNACLSSTSCRAVALDWANGGECTLYGSTNYEALESKGAVVPQGRQVFLSYSRFLYEEMLNGTMFDGATSLKAYDNVESRRACNSLCNAWVSKAMGACSSVEYSPSSKTCTLLTGGKRLSLNNESSDPFIMSKVPVNPFVEVQAASEVCPDDTAVLFEMSGLFNAEACQSLCLSENNCGLLSYDRTSGLCRLYDGASFLRSDCGQHDTKGTIYVSYLQFVVRDTLSFASLVTKQNAPGICISNGTSISKSLDVVSRAACAVLCQEAPKLQECGAFLYDHTQKTCELMMHDLEVTDCHNPSSSILSIAYKRMSFTSLEDRCLSDTNPMNTYSGIRDYPECSALCEATFGCRAFKMDDSSCKLYKSTESITCGSNDSSEGSFVSFSDKLYTWLGSEYMVSPDTKILEFEDIELEACKQLCDLVESCESYEHDANGDCALYQSRDVVPCPGCHREVYLSSARFYDVSSPVQMAALPNTCLTYLKDSSCSKGSCGLGDTCSAGEDCKSPLVCEPPNKRSASLSTFLESGTAGNSHNFCVLPGTTNNTRAKCIENCQFDASCIGVYRQDEACLTLTSEDLQRIEPSSSCGDDSDSELMFKYRKNPYQKMEKACLRNPLNTIGPFTHADLVDCMNICDSFPTCRHFTHSIDRNCALYGAQVGGVEEDCTLPDGETAYLNSRSFLDAIEYMGVPERVFAEVRGLSYDECAATCNRLGQCNAFIHESGVRLSPGNAKSLCLKAAASSKVSLAECDPADEDQAFTHVPDLNRWVHQKKAKALQSKRKYHFLEGLCGMPEEPPIDVPDREACEDQCTFHPQCMGYRLESNGRKCILQRYDSKVFDRVFDGQLGKTHCGSTTSWVRGYIPSYSNRAKGNTIVNGMCFNDKNNLLEEREGDWLECAARCNELDQCIGFEYCPAGKDCSHSRRGSSGYQTVTRFLGEKHGACFLRSKTGEPSCIPARIGSNALVLSHRVMTFRKDAFQDGSMVSQSDKCLESSGDGGVKELRLGFCSKNNNARSQSTLGPGNSILFGNENECLATKSDENSGQLDVAIVPCGSADFSQKWLQDSICQLTTRERTQSFKLESTASEGMCLAMDRKILDDSSCDSLEASKPKVSFRDSGVVDVGLALCDSVDATVLQYFYAQSKDNPFLLKQVNSTQCVSRDMDPNDEAKVQEGPVSWGSCGINNAARNTWELVNGTTFTTPKTDDKTQVKIFDLTYSSCNQKVVSSNLPPTDVSLIAWKKYGMGNAAVELAIKPNALIQEITDPVAKLQIWLFSDDGKRSRMLLSRLDLFGEFPKILSNFMGEIDNTVSKIGGGLAATTAFTDPLSTGAEKAVRFVSIVVPVLMFLERLPYVGPVLKLIRLRSIVKAAKSQIKKGKRTLVPFNSTVGTGHTAVVALPVTLTVYKGVFDGLPEKFEVLGRGLVRLMRCAFVDGNARLQDTLNSVTDGIIEAVDMGYAAMTSLRQVLTGLGDFWNVIERAVVKPIGAVKRKLDLVNKIFDKFKFLQTLIEFKIKFKIPIIGRIEFGLSDIANFLGKIERTIKKIPFVGSAWSAVERIVQSVLGMIFPKIELPLPSLNFLDKLSPFDTLGDTLETIVSSVSQRITDAVALVDNWVADIAEGVDFDSILDRIDAGLPDFDLLTNCQDASGNLASSCLARIAVPSVPGVPTDFIQDGLDMYDKVKDQLQALVQNNIGIIANIIGKFECLEKTTIPFPDEAFEGLFESIGINCNNTKECASIFGSSMPTEISYCTEYGLDEADARSAIQPLISDVENLFLQAEANSNVDDRRRLKGFNERIAELGLGAIFSFTLPLSDALSCARVPTPEDLARTAMFGEKWELRAEKVLDIKNGKILKFQDTFSSDDSTKAPSPAPTPAPTTKSPTPSPTKKPTPRPTHAPITKAPEPSSADAPAPASRKLITAPRSKGEPGSLSLALSLKDALGINLAISAKEVVKGNSTIVRPIIRFSMGARVQIQLAAGLIFNFKVAVDKKLKEVQKFNKRVSEIVARCPTCNADTFEDEEDIDLCNLCAQFKFASDRKRREFNRALTRDYYDVLEGVREAKPYSRLVENASKLRAKRLVKNIGALVKAATNANEINNMKFLERLFKTKSPCAAAKKASFGQFRIKARGTEFPRKGIQLFYGNQLQFALPSALNPFKKENNGFTIRKDFFQFNRKTDKPLIVDHQKEALLIGNNAMLFSQNSPPEQVALSGHIGLGFTMFAFEKVIGNEDRGDRLVSFPMFDKDKDIDDDE